MQGWDVLTDAPSEAGTHATVLQERVSELEAEVRRLKLALEQQAAAGASVSAGAGASASAVGGEADSEGAAQEPATALADGWLLAEESEGGSSVGALEAPAEAQVCRIDTTVNQGTC